MPTYTDASQPNHSKIFAESAISTNLGDGSPQHTSINVSDYSAGWVGLVNRANGTPANSPPLTVDFDFVFEDIFQRVKWQAKKDAREWSTDIKYNIGEMVTKNSISWVSTAPDNLGINPGNVVVNTGEWVHFDEWVAMETAATQAEVNGGAVDNKFITPETLSEGLTTPSDFLGVQLNNYIAPESLGGVIMKSGSVTAVVAGSAVGDLEANIALPFDGVFPTRCINVLLQIRKVTASVSEHRNLQACLVSFDTTQALVDLVRRQGATEATGVEIDFFAWGY